MVSPRSASVGTTAHSTVSRSLRLVAIPLMLGTGALVAGQSEINGRLAGELGNGARAGVGAALISFGTGLAVLALLTLVSPRHRAGVSGLVAAVRRRRIHPLELFGGLFGAFLVASQGLSVGVIGVALFSVAVTAGQSTSGLLVDHWGLGPSGHRPLSIPRLVAATFAVLAVTLATAERLAAAFSWQTLLFALLPLLAGAGIAVQQAINGRVSHHVGPWIATLNNFTVGTVGLTVAFLASLLLDGGLRTPPDEWWLYLGGVMGIVFIWMAALLVKVHGVLVFGLTVIAGQVTAAELIEATISHTHVGPLGIAAGGITVLGVGIALLLRPRTR